MTELPSDSAARPGWWWPEIAAVLLPVLFSVVALGPRAALPPDSEILGFLQHDQPSYYACAREVFENGNILFAGSPWSNEPGSPRIHTNLTFTFFGLLWKFGMPFTVMDPILRVLFGAGMMLLLVQVFRAALPSPRLVLPACIAALACGGLAWFFALARFTSDTLFNLGAFGFEFTFDSLAARYPGLHAGAEGGYADWHLNLFRTLTYAPETIYHTLFFACMLALMRGAWRWALGFLFLAWWAHPFTGLEAGVIVSVFTLLDGWLLKRMPRWPFSASLGVNGVFLLYYAVLLPLNADHASVAENLRAFGNPMLFSMLIPAHGIFLAGAAAFLALPRARAMLPGRPAPRLMLCWLVCVAALVFHDRILFFMRPMQPMHFTRGYLHVALVYWCVCGLDALLMRPSLSRRANAAWILLILLHLPDNALALLRQRALNTDPVGVFYRPSECMEFYRRLDALNETLTIHSLAVHPACPGFEYLVPVFTHHRVLLGHWANTPLIGDKQALAQRIYETPSRDLLARAGITALIVDDRAGALLRDFLNEDEMGVVLEWRGLRCVRLKPEPEADDGKDGG